jgi:hypothetical protein
MLTEIQSIKSAGLAADGENELFPSADILGLKNVFIGPPKFFCTLNLAA